MKNKIGKHSKYRIVRSAIKSDLLIFGFPSLLVFVAGQIVSGWDGYDGLLRALWNVIRHPENFDQLSIWNNVGLGMCVVGFTIAIVAAFTLGRFYASTLVIREDHRHPVCTDSWCCPP